MYYHIRRINPLGMNVYLKDGNTWTEDYNQRKVFPTLFQVEQFKKTVAKRSKKQSTELDKNDRKQFLKGAEIAYETIITSFSKGDKESLKSLLTEKMQANFVSAIEARKVNNIKSELTFIGIKSSAIQKFEKTAEALFFTVKFVSEIISVKKDKNNKIIEGDPNKIKTVIDSWRFTRKISSISPNWYLAEIENS